MNKNIFNIRNFPKNILIYFIKLYQKHISKYLGRNCRYYPTCSEYTIQAVDKYGIIKGSILGIIRILKCNPFFKGGVDKLK